MKVLFVADVIGSPGRKAVRSLLGGVKEDTGADVIIINGENAAGGFGITPEIAHELIRAGAAVITTGNHVWDKKEIIPMLQKDARILRPGNFPPSNPGRGSTVVNFRGTRLGVINLQGRTFMPPLDDPFRAADSLIAAMEGEADAIVVDFHAEATSEKQAMAYYLDGRVGAVVGTHTHVQTADERLLPKNTAAITDLGMTGGLGGIIGMKAEISLQRQLTMARGERMQPSDEDLHLQGAVVDLDTTTGLARGIERISVHYAQTLQHLFRRG